VLQAASAPVAAQALPASALEKPVSALPSPVGSVTVAKSSPTQVPAPVVALRMDKSLTLHGLADTPVAGRAASAAATERPKIAPTTAVAPSAAHPAAASNEALAQAQNLWNAGSRDAAIDLLRDAVALAARSGTVGVGANGNALLLPLVREVTRMQLADSRYAAVWDLLTQLESQLGNQADLWAIRAHAAQRLGRHQDSVHAYMAALQSRPNEQRWLLGAAVSLAALGQTESASEMADKARAVGPVSKDVQVYLRQMNVPLKDQ
jgi:tetratricopeptide (TPR) repeat protein